MATDADTVLVVEDEDEARAFLVQILEFEGFRVVGFANGAEALDHLARSERTLPDRHGHPYAGDGRTCL